MKYLLCLLCLIVLPNTNAKSIYKHTLPFFLTLKENDTIIMNYDFSAKNGLKCVSTDDQVIIYYTYKGHEKCSTLPVTLQNNLPQHPEQALADMVGTFIIKLSKKPSRTIIACDYLVFHMQ